MSLPVTVVLLACVCPLHANVGNTRANHVCSAHVHQVAFELYHIIDCLCYEPDFLAQSLTRLENIAICML